ncbi:MAG: hypothetical protein A2452_09620 [Candidatus Firestonebacteria bacterium RIFOXYC2_FULL_39_67]|nr:MAG: hypothetical protein A2536_07055 [Candidatus Firestonebacteria bacterium RIFOXYD2_FULL_39_29]OGF56708.1 MAG: hypothetical protein A2452_09620 [Candidatus Firestonebacteria bacterium RIFOXYC2_FULL_39_67]
MKTIMKSLRFPVEILDKSREVMRKKKINFTQLTMAAVSNYVAEVKYEEKVNEAFGIWKTSKHKELKNGTDSYIRKVRRTGKG